MVRCHGNPRLVYIVGISQSRAGPGARANSRTCCSLLRLEAHSSCTDQIRTKRSEVKCDEWAEFLAQARLLHTKNKVNRTRNKRITFSYQTMSIYIKSSAEDPISRVSSEILDVFFFNSLRPNGFLENGPNDFL
jgi:hypothetical protein